MNVCGRAHRWPVCRIFMFELQIVIAPFALFHHSLFVAHAFSMGDLDVQVSVRLFIHVLTTTLASDPPFTLESTLAFTLN